MKHFKYILGILLLGQPLTLFAGGETSGSGVIKASYTFSSQGFARIEFRKQNGSDVYTSDKFHKEVEPVRLWLLGRKKISRPDQNLCSFRDSVQSVNIYDSLGTYLSHPKASERWECTTWFVDHKENYFPRKFKTERRAKDWADESKNSRGEPYCTDENYEWVQAKHVTAFKVNYYAKTRDHKKVGDQTFVGKHRYKLWPCEHFDRKSGGSVKSIKRERERARQMGIESIENESLRVLQGDSYDI